MIIKVLDRVDLRVKKDSNLILDHQKHGFDIIADNSYSVKTINTASYNLRDILHIREKNIDYFYSVDKRVDNQSINFKSLLNYFDDYILLPDPTLTLKGLFDNYYVDYQTDPHQNVGWLDTSEVDDTYPINLNSVTNNATNDLTTTQTFSVKDIIVNTILARRFSFIIENDLNNGKLKFIIKPTTNLPRINLNAFVIQNLQLPQVNTTVNTLDVVLNVTHNVTTLDVDGVEQTTEEALRTEKTRYCVTTSNDVTANLDTSGRILPVKLDVIVNTWNQDGDSPKPNSLEIAEGKLVETSNYYWSFELVNERLMYAFDINIGDMVEIWYNGLSYVSLCTGIEFNKATTKYMFGLNRTDLVFKIKNK